MKNMDLKKMILLEMGFSLAFIILGIAMFFIDFLTTKTINILVGLFLLVRCGLEFIISRNVKKYYLFQYSLVISIVCLLLGIIVMFARETFSNVLVLVLGLWLVLESLNKFMISLKFKNNKLNFSKIYLISSLIGIFMAIIVIINPFINFASTQIAGIFISLYSILNLSNLVLVKNNIKKIIKK